MPSNRTSAKDRLQDLLKAHHHKARLSLVVLLLLARPWAQGVAQETSAAQQTHKVLPKWAKTSPLQAPAQHRLTPSSNNSTTAASAKGTLNSSSSCLQQDPTLLSLTGQVTEVPTARLNWVPCPSNLAAQAAHQANLPNSPTRPSILPTNAPVAVTASRPVCATHHPHNPPRHPLTPSSA